MTENRLNLMHSARVLSLQSRKCSIGSSWKSIITACIWNQRNTQMLRGTQASSIITGSLFHENKSVKITNKCTQVQIFLTYSLSKFYTKKIMVRIFSRSTVWRYYSISNVSVIWVIIISALRFRVSSSGSQG